MNRPRTVLDDILDRANFSPVTCRRYEDVIGHWIEFAGPDPMGWTRLAAQRFYAMQLERVQANKIKIKTANSYVECLRYVSRWYHVQHGGEDFAIVQRMKVPVEQSKRRSLPPKEVIALLDTCEGDLPIARRPIDRRDRTMLIVGFETGMRVKSLAGALIENIATKPYPYITVPVKGPTGTAIFDVPLSDTAMLAISDWAGWLRSQGVKQGPLFQRLRLGINSKGHRAHTPTGTTLSAVSFYKIVEARGKEAKIDHVHPHLMRHTFITWRALTLSAPQIASITGHHVEAQRALGGLDNVGRMASYFDLKALGETARQATPPWFADHVRRLIGG